ncbi:hypothetical protein D3C78_629620 [compost metagenome]
MITAMFFQRFAESFLLHEIRQIRQDQYAALSKHVQALPDDVLRIYITREKMRRTRKQNEIELTFDLLRQFMRKSIQKSRIVQTEPFCLFPVECKGRFGGVHSDNLTSNLC